MEALELTGKDNIADKIVIDATNPIAELPPIDGVLQYFTEQNGSLMEKNSMDVIMLLLFRN